MFPKLEGEFQHRVARIPPRPSLQASSVVLPQSARCGPDLLVLPKCSPGFRLDPLADELEVGENLEATWESVQEGRRREVDAERNEQ